MRWERCVSAGFVLGLIGAVSLHAEDWPQFRGPAGQGIASGKPVALQFSEDEGLLWKTALPGRGWSSPVVLNGQVWMTCAMEDGKSLRALCVDLKTGTLTRNVEVFTPSQPVFVNAKNSHASPTPVIEPGRVYVHFGAMGTACLDTETGQVLWKTEEFVIDHKEGPGSSPILVDDLLIVHCDGRDQQYVLALDRKSGTTRWKVKRSAPLRDNPEFKKAYCTPLLIEVDGRRQLISPGADQVQAYDPATGDELWRIRYSGFSTVPRPVYSDGLLYVCTGYMKPELWALRPDGENDVTASHVAWKFTRQVPANPSPISVNGLLFFVSDGGVVTCLEALSGKQLWQQRLGGNYWSSPVAVGDRLYFSSESGVVTVLRASREYEVLATNRFKGAFFASPAVVDGTLLLRSDTHLYRTAQP